MLVWLILSIIAKQSPHGRRCVGDRTQNRARRSGETDHQQHPWRTRKARRAYVRIAGFLAGLRKTAEQLDRLEKWYRILSEALRHFLKGRKLQPPLRLNPS